MITLYSFGSQFGLPDVSPFVVKAELLLKMANLPYTKDTNGVRQAPKGKLPYIKDDGAFVADSSFIRMHIEKKYHINYNLNLNGHTAATLWALERMCEEHLYFGLAYERWAVEHNFKVGPASYDIFKAMPRMIRPLILKKIRKAILKSLSFQGMGKHTWDDIYALCEPDIEALSQILSDQRYFGGNDPCGADATFAAFIGALLCPIFDSKLRIKIESCQNLVDYHHRMRARFYPELG